MGCFDSYCLICGGPLRNRMIKGNSIFPTTKNKTITIKRTYEDYNWLNDLYLLPSAINTTTKEQQESKTVFGLSTKIELDGLKHYIDYGKVTVDNVCYFLWPHDHPIQIHVDNCKREGSCETINVLILVAHVVGLIPCDAVVCHRACFHTLEKQYHGYQLSYVDTKETQHAQEGRWMWTIPSVYNEFYKEMRQFTGAQVFDVDTVHRTYNWLLKNPNKSRKNRSRIRDAWGLFVSVQGARKTTNCPLKRKKIQNG